MMVLLRHVFKLAYIFELFVAKYHFSLDLVE
jgi:hypothetical protein